MDYSKWEKLDYDSDEELCKPRVAHEGIASTGRKLPAKQAVSRNVLCWTCYEPGAGLRCSKCKQVFFCSRECQQRGWKRHKFQCREPEDVASKSKEEEEFSVLVRRRAEQEELEYGPMGELGPVQAMMDENLRERVGHVPPSRRDLGLAVIIPFRQQLPLQNRGPHLEQLIAHLHAMFGRLVSSGWMRRWKLLVVQQAEDSMPFNRGALLNAGFDFLDRSGETFDQVVLHDADLLPADEATEVWYATAVPEGHVVHLTANGYAKYDSASRTEGTAPGVVTLGWNDFRASNGFPLDVWGWAASLEDSVWFQRLGLRGMRYFPCPVGAWRDLDAVDLADSPEALEDAARYYDDAWLRCSAHASASAEPLPAELFDRRGGLDTPRFYRALRDEPCLGHAALLEVGLCQ